MALHALLFVLLPALAQAQIVDDRGVHSFLSASWGPQIEGRQRAPFKHVGLRQTIEGGILIPGGSLFHYECGVRASATTVRADYDDAWVDRSLGVLAGVRIRLVPPLAGRMELFARGGFSVAHEDESGPGAEDGINLGPHLGIGLAYPLGKGASLGVHVLGVAQIAPMVVDVSFGLNVVATRF